MNLKERIQQFMLAALTNRQPLGEREESIARHLAQTGEGDHGLAAVREIIALRLLEVTAYEGAMSTSDTDKLRYAERRETLRCLYAEIEQRVEQVKAEKLKRES